MFSPWNTRKSFSQHNILRNLGIWDQSRDPFGTALPGSRGFSRIRWELLEFWVRWEIREFWIFQSEGLGNFIPFQREIFLFIPFQSRIFLFISFQREIPLGKFLFIPLQREFSSSSPSRGNSFFFPLQREIPEGIFLFFSSFSKWKFPLHPIPEGKFLFIPSFFQMGISSSSHSQGKPRGKIPLYPIIFQREFSSLSHSIGNFPLHPIPHPSIPKDRSHSSRTFHRGMRNYRDFPFNSQKKIPERRSWLGWEEQEWVEIEEFLEFWVGIWGSELISLSLKSSRILDELEIWDQIPTKIPKLGSGNDP